MLAERRDDVAPHLLGLRLGLRREVLLDVELAERLADRLAGEIDPALPALALLLRAGEHAAVEREGLVDEGLGRIGRGALDGVEGQVVLPDRERLAADELRDARDRARLPGSELALLPEARAAPK